MLFDFLTDFFLLEVEFFAFFPPFDEFETFVDELEPPPEEAAGAGEWVCDDAVLEEPATTGAVGASAGLTGGGGTVSCSALPVRTICDAVWAWRKRE